MKITIFFFVLSVSFQLHAQTNKVGFKDFYVGVKPIVTQLLVTKNDFTTHFNSKSSYDPTLGISISLGSEYYISEKWAFRAGFSYSFVNFTRRLDGLLFATDRDPITNTAKTSSSIKTYNTLQYVDIPVSILHYLDKKRTRYVGASLGMNVLVQKKSHDKTFYGNGTIDEVNFYKSDKIELSNYHVELFGGYRINTSSNVSLLLQPYVNLKLKREELTVFGAEGFQISYGAAVFLNFSSLKKRK